MRIRSRTSAIGIAAVLIAGAVAWIGKTRDEAFRPSNIPWGFPRDTAVWPGRSLELPGDLSALPAADRALYRRAIELNANGQRDRAREVLLELLRRAPSFAEGMLQLSRWERDALRDTIADSLIERGLVADPGHPWLLFDRGRRHLARGDFARARRDIETAVDFSPVFPEALEELARLELLENRPERAQTMVQLAISMRDGKEGSRYDLLAEILFVRERDDSAREVVDHGFDLHPREPRYLWLRGLISEGRGDTAAARRDYQQALTLGRLPEIEEALRTLGLKPLHGIGRLGTAFTGERGRDAGFMLEVLGPLARQRPDNAALWYALGRAHQERGLYAQADEHYTRALSLDSSLVGLSDWAARNRDLLLRRTRLLRPPATITPAVTAVTAADDAWYDLGHYRVAWGTSKERFSARFPTARFDRSVPGVLTESRTMWGIRHEHSVWFDTTGLWAVRVILRDAGRTTLDLLEEGIRLNALQAGSGVLADPSACPGLGQIESVVWENADTWEIMLFRVSHPQKLGLLRMDRRRVTTRSPCVLFPLVFDTIPG